jgi:hypothetical protein
MTSPGPDLSQGDRQRLDRLIDRVAGYLRGYPPDAVDETLGRLRALADQGSDGPVDHGLQLTVGPGVDELKPLPAARADRVILEPSPGPAGLGRFREPEYGVLVLTDHEVRLYEAVGGALYEVRNGSFPLHRSDAPMHAPTNAPTNSARTSRQTKRRAFFLRADAALARYVSTRPVPIVLVGLSRHLRLFAELTAQADRIVAEVPGNYGRAPASALAPIVNRRLAARRAI